MALVTRSDDQVLLYIINTLTAEPLIPDPIDIAKLSDRSGLCVQFVPAPGGVPGLALFVGSLKQLVAVRGGRVVDSGLDVNSLKLSDRYSIESCAYSAGTLAIGMTTLPWGGRSLHVALFDLLQSRKCLKAIEALKFRFGGSAQFGIKSVGLSQDAAIVCACVKQTKMKTMVWKSSTGDLLASVDVDDDSISKCVVLGPSDQFAAILSTSTRSSPSKEGQRRPQSYVWTSKDSSARLLGLDMRYDCNVADATTPQTAALAQWRTDASTVVINYWCQPNFADTVPHPNRKYIVHGVQDDVMEMVVTDRSVVLLSSVGYSLYSLQDLEEVEGGSDGATVPREAVVDSLGFVPRSDDPIVAFRDATRRDDEGGSFVACTLTARAGEAPIVGNQLFSTSVSGVGDDVIDPSRDSVFPAPGKCSYVPDASCALICDVNGIRARDLPSGSTRVLPVPDDVIKMADVDPDNNRATGNTLLFAASPKDCLVGVVYRQAPHTVYLIDTRPTSKTKPLRLVVEDQTHPVTVFSFLPANGHVISYYQKSSDALVVWNQRSGAIVSREAVADLCYIRVSPASDRMALSMRSCTSGASLILRSSDNRFSVPLSASVTWQAEATSSDAEFSGDGTALVGFSDGCGCLWNAGNGELLRIFDASAQAEVVGWPTNAHALLHDPANQCLLVADVISGRVVAAAATDGPIGRKWSARRLRVSPRGGVVVGATEDGELRVYVCRNMASVRRQTTLQVVKSSAAVTSPK